MGGGCGVVLVDLEKLALKLVRRESRDLACSACASGCEL